MAKVSDLLKLPALRGAKVVAGCNRLDRKVEYVTVMEVPDIKRWLKGNDFLITSFYSVRKSEEDQCRLIMDLADTCSCMAVKTGQYVSRISDKVKETADRCGLPILEIPFEKTYIDMIVSIMNLIFEEEGRTEILEKYVKDIIYENYSDEILMTERGRLFGFEVDKDYFAAVNLSFRKRYIPTEAERKSLRFLSQTLVQYLMRNDSVRGCYKISLEKGILLLLEGEDAQKLENSIGYYLTEERIRKMWTMGHDKISCAVGPVRKGMKGIRDTYSLSYKAMHVGRKLYQNQILYSYEKLQIFCALEEALMKEDGRLFTSILEPVKNQELLDTLMMYYMCGTNLDQVAEKMYTHKNTVKYRLNRIQEQNKLDLRNPDDNFRIYLAVLAMKMKSR